MSRGKQSKPFAPQALVVKQRTCTTQFSVAAYALSTPIYPQQPKRPLWQSRATKAGWLGKTTARKNQQRIASRPYCQCTTFGTALVASGYGAHANRPGGFRGGLALAAPFQYAALCFCGYVRTAAGTCRFSHYGPVAATCASFCPDAFSLPWVQSPNKITYPAALVALHVGVGGPEPKQVFSKH